MSQMTPRYLVHFCTELWALGCIESKHGINNKEIDMTKGHTNCHFTLVFCPLMTRDTQRLLDSASVLVDIPTQPPRFAHFDRCICELCFIANAKVRNRKNTTWQLATSLPRYKITVAGCILRILPICLAYL